MRGTMTGFALFCALACACVSPFNSGADASNILALFPHPGRSHQMVFEPLFRKLSERGHHVTVVSFFPVLDSPLPPTYRDVSLVGMNDIHLAIVDLANFEMDLWGMERFIGEAIGMFHLADYATSICRKFLDWPAVQDLARSNETYDVILVENFNSDCMLGFAERYKAPFVALLSHNLMTWSSDRLGVPDNPSYVPAMGTRFTDRMTLMERVENTLFLYYFKAFFRHCVQEKEQAILEKHYGHKITDLGELSRNYSLMLVNTHHSLNGVRPLVPGVVEVSGMHLERPAQLIPPNVETFLNESKDGVILFSFGSLIKSATLPKHRLQSFYNVFRRLPQRVIWKWEGSMEEHDNIMTLKWIPQYELLQHPKVIAYIGHGGLLGLTEAAAAGKPMLVIPLFGDQPGNAAAAEQAGLARVLQYKNVNEDNLYSELQTVLSPGMRASAAHLSRVWHDRPMPPLDTAVYWVERTARLGYRQNLASRARELPAYQLALIDVAAVAVAVLAALAIILYVCIKVAIRFVKMISKKKVKLH